jgi:PAS domain S-box-containing protein
MQQVWYWIAFGTLSLMVVYQQFLLFKHKRDSRKREELFQIVTENAADMIALVDVKGHRLYNSPAYKRILGYSAAELGETSAFEQIHPDDRFKVLEAAREARETGVGKRLEYRIRHKDGRWLVLESIASAVRDDRGEVSKLVIVNRDITERKRAEEQLEHNLFHDPLTGLPNRRSFLDRLQEAYVHVRRDAARPYALLLANVDHFKVFNEILGTEAGDELLQEIGRRIGGCLRQDDMLSRSEGEKDGMGSGLSRLGGDEFADILDSVSDPSDAMRIAKRIQAVVAEPFFCGKREVRASLSVGIALSSAEHNHPDDILKDAAAATRRAKSLGGSRCEVFDEAMHSRAEGRLRLESDLRAAMAAKQFRIHYQPVVQLDSRNIVSFEALLRWEHPTQGLISPFRFIEAAEDSGILVSIGYWLILQACKQVREWECTSSWPQPIRLAVNVSARQFADGHLVNDIQDALRETGVDPSRLQLEITESVAATDPKLTMTVLSHLKHMGIGVILDGFGIGSASLRGLWQFPVDAVKIDRSLVMEMQTDQSSKEIIEAIITLAHQRGLQVIAQGIETPRQLERLRELGCEYGQGYYISQPLDAKVLLQFVQGVGLSARA